NPQKHCSARLHSKPSKLVMRVRFPSSALAAESHSPGSERPPHQADGPVAGQITLNPAPVGCTCIRGVDSANLGGDQQVLAGAGEPHAGVRDGAEVAGRCTDLALGAAAVGRVSLLPQRHPAGGPDGSTMITSSVPVSTPISVTASPA